MEAAAAQVLLSTIPGKSRAEAEVGKETEPTESSSVFNVKSGTSPPTCKPPQETQFPLPGNKGVENF